MAEKVEGTIVLDGLLEGTVPDDPSADRLRRAVEQASDRLPLSLEIDGRHFSVLAMPRAVDAGSLGGDPAREIEAALNDVLRAVPADWRREVFSTLRSVEYRRGAEVQTLYAASPEGLLRARQRTVDARTVAPPQPMTLRQKLRRAGLGLLVAAAVFGVSALFVDYRAMVRGFIDRLTPLDASAITVDASAYEGRFTVEGKSLGNGRRLLVLTLKRGNGFPLSADDYDRMLAEAGGSLARRLALEALVRGYVRCELFDGEGKFLSAAEIRVASLRDRESVEVSIPLPPDGRPARVVIGY